MKETFKKVFGKKKNIFLTILFSVIFFLFIILIQNLVNIKNIFSSSLLDLSSKIESFGASFLSFFTNYHLLGQISIILMSILIGMNIVLVKDYWKRQYSIKKHTATSSIGLIVGLLGIGCASCGGVLLTLIFGTGATTFLATKFPLGGMEISLIAVAIIAYSNYFVLKKLSEPNVC